MLTRRALELINSLLLMSVGGIRSILAVAAIVFLTSCTGGNSGNQVAYPSDNEFYTAANSMPTAAVYQLGPGDETRLIVFGEPNLSGEFIVDSEGVLSLPLIGQVSVGGLTIRVAEQMIADRLMRGYLNDPKVNLEVLNYRPFFIFGEVETGGQYNYQAGITIYNAIALAGGYTYRADRSRVLIAHKGSKKEVEYPASQETLVRPGDVIRVPEKFF